MKSSFLAADLGAGSGRVIAGTLDHGQLSLQELNRFPNKIIKSGDGLHWDINALFNGILEGFEQCRTSGLVPESVAIDSWGVDYGLLDENGSFVNPPRCYRDPRNNAAFESFLFRVPRKKLYERTGIQFLPFNTVFQLEAEKQNNPDAFGRAKKLLFIPDIFNYMLTGETKTEFTFATTSQLYDPIKRTWSEELFHELGVTSSLMQEIISPGTTIGTVRDEYAKKTGVPRLLVLAVGSHDTASAVAGVPMTGRSSVYISSGTWSLMGIETDLPIITEQAYETGFTNEGGVAGTFRFLKNITGTWLLSECRRSWSAEKEYSFDELTARFEEGRQFRSMIDPDWKGFLSPDDMTIAISEFCNRTGQPVPGGHPDFIRCIIESLALKYRFVLDQIRQFITYPIEAIHIVGGGSLNRVLCQCAADATGLLVYAGPAEATAIGNILVQAMAMKYVSSLEEIRTIIRKSFEIKSYIPRKSLDWDKAYEKFRTFIDA